MARTSEMVRHVASALRAAGGLHRPDDAELLARVAIAAMRELIPTVRDHEGEPCHALYGAPDDVWRTFIDAALSSTQNRSDTREGVRASAREPTE